MAIGIDDLDDDDLSLESGSLTTEEPVTEPLQTVESTPDNDLADFLRTRGIDDISRIKFEDDNGNIEERSWDSLTKTEKFNILNTPIAQDDFDLSLEELDLLNQIRQSNLTPTQYLEQFQAEQPAELQYKIDDLSDDELFLLDLESRVGELTEEMAVQALSNAKLNEELFKKQTEGIRKEYKEREDYLLQQEQAEIEQQLLEAYNQFQDSVIDSVNRFNAVGNLDLNFDDSDREELASFMLSRDETGQSYLWQALQDSDTLVKAAWFILNGDKAVNSISDYFVNLIKLVSDNQYKKGFEEGRKGMNPSRPTLVIDSSKKTNQHRLYNSIDELDDDD